MSNEEPESGKCLNCETICSKDDYCSGCRVFVCEGCERNGTLVGFSHKPEEHLNEANDGGW